MSYLFPKSAIEERQKWRDAIHESRNTASRSQAAARLSKRSSDKALEAAEYAIRLLENTQNKDEADGR
jgi:hypothetical protein